MSTRIRKVKTEKEFENTIDEFITIGYSLKDQGEQTAMLMKAEYGGVLAHILIFLLTGWFLFGLGNIAWAIYNYYTNSDKVLLKIVEE